jgi:hypothetical protein
MAVDLGGKSGGFEGFVPGTENVEMDGFPIAQAVHVPNLLPDGQGGVKALCGDMDPDQDEIPTVHDFARFPSNVTEGLPHWPALAIRASGPRSVGLASGTT